MERSDFFRSGRQCDQPRPVSHPNYDLPGLDDRLRAGDTGDIPLLLRNHSERDIAWWRAFDGASREEIRRVSTHMGGLYTSFIRSGHPRAGWPQFDTADWNVLWLGQ